MKFTPAEIDELVAAGAVRAPGGGVYQARDRVLHQNAFENEPSPASDQEVLDALVVEILARRPKPLVHLQ